jgi:hypothetical protein
MPSPVVLFAVVIQLLPVLYLLIASPAFLLVSLDIPQVAQLLRIMFYGYFFALIAAGMAGTLAVALGGHWLVTPVFGVVAAGAVLWRHWLLGRMDRVIANRQLGRTDTAAELRRLHWFGMLANAGGFIAILMLVPSLT